jgi:hypothetical protein
VPISKLSALEKQGIRGSLKEGLPTYKSGKSDKN